MTFARYPRMKPSGYEWIGEVPDHWKLDRLGSYFVERREKVSDRDFPPLSVTMNGIVPQLETAAKTDDGDNRKRVEFGDFVINSRSDRRGSSGLSSLRGSVSLINTVLKPRGVHGRYIHYLFKSVPFVDEYYRLGKGIVADLWSTNYSQMRLIGLAIPTDSEQLAIADFLDAKTSAIDNLIRKKERLIEVLQEKRQAVITQAVTKGLDPTVPMKDSGVAWLGTIPSHWQLVALRRGIARFVDYRGKTPEKVDSGIPLITAGAIKSGRIQHELAPDYIQADDYSAWMVRGFPKLGDVLMTTEAPLGEVAQIDDENVALAQRVILLKTKPEILNSDYLALQLRSALGQGELWSNATGSTALGIKADRLKGIRLLLPPLEEQEAIVTYVNARVSRYDVVAEHVSEQVQALREYRQTLITAAVTGKIDVRQYVEKHIPAAQEEVPV